MLSLQVFVHPESFSLRYVLLEASGKHRLNLCWLEYLRFDPAWCWALWHWSAFWISSNRIASEKTTLGLLEGWKLHGDFLCAPRLGLMCSTQVVLGLPDGWSHSTLIGSLVWGFSVIKFPLLPSNRLLIIAELCFLKAVFYSVVVICSDVYECRKLVVTFSKVISILCFESSSGAWIKSWLVWHWAYLWSFESVKWQEVGKHRSMRDLERLANLAIDSFITSLIIF